MKIVALSGSRVGSKTRTAMNYAVNVIRGKYPNAEVTLLDLADYDVQFSDGRHYMDYEGDTKFVAQTVMDADALIIGTPVFQASIPATLKNVFDLLPEKSLRDKVASIIVTAGSPKHYLIAEQQIKPILSYMRAQIVQSYVFIEEKDFYQKEIVNEDVLLRISRLVEDTVMLTETYAKIKEAKEAKEAAYISRD
ncbi:NADPH-dependent FMN reductase [Weizmannia coagulans]|jgi:FMN reductase|uniref:NADPH-dependent FMN reductase n=3 Tax=Heyndrickxia TaxID=2837504 RepID=G2TQG0_HEYCO|nr:MULTISPECIES: NADPH-dependent FMN reductase [Heyndrickxia]AEO99808.1 NADPH-dependent FMN reductase [Heyndrickxia coagulans 36D1]AJO24092.1 NADPH-dependent FMN reductase [Heyndrickxia coagulans]AKN54428.1 FMN reductase [Heyndrickxia coagulans]ATW84025.1 NAD(P)H-dependent oxidoreductase [Heyndrickxia coagulans]AWP36196.1 NAD(P)H-dependent oxidoreductase [Heyndrickxia coagulans]